MTNFSLAALMAVAHIENLIKTEKHSNKRLSDLADDLRDAAFRYRFGTKCENPGCDADARRPETPKAFCSDWCRAAAKRRAAEDEARIAEACAEHGGS